MSVFGSKKCKVNVKLTVMATPWEAETGGSPLI